MSETAEKPADDAEVDDVMSMVESISRSRDSEEDRYVRGEVISQDKPSLDLKVAALIPMHQLGNMGKRPIGRPKKINPQPTTSDLLYHARTAEIQKEFVAQDPMVKASVARTSSIDTLHMIKERLARVLATMEYRRIEDEKRGGSLSAQMLSREMVILREISQLELRINETSVKSLDLSSPDVQKVFALFAQKIQTVAGEILEPALLDLFLNRLSTSLEGWEKEAEALLR